MSWRIALGAASVCWCVIGCSGSQTAPTDQTAGSPSLDPPAVPTAPSGVRRELWLDCSSVLNGYQCDARLFTEGQPGTSLVTRLARWSSSDPSIATVNQAGFITVLKTQEVTIRVRYEDVEASVTMTMQAGGDRYYFRSLSGWITDAQTGEKLLSGVTVLIVNGPNAGRTVQGGADGAYQLYDLQPGSFTVRFSKAGYRTLDRTAVLPGDRLVSLDAALTRNPS